MRSLSRLSSLLLVAAALSAAGCTSPCVSLADTICDCKPNQPERNLCAQQVSESSAGKSDVTDAEALACEALLLTCTCEALERGELGACGLTP
jgi:hypothetical protein